MIRRIYIHRIERKICIVETYSSGGYGAYHISKFMVELNRTVVLPGDFHRYILNNIADFIQNPQRTGADPIHYFSGADIIDEDPKDLNVILKSMYTVIHEATHLMQDFTLGSEMLRDILYDFISGQSLVFLKQFEMYEKEAPLPLMRLERYQQNEKITALRELYDTIYKEYACIELLNKQQIPLGTTDLVEAYAAARAFHYMIQTEPDIARSDKLNVIFHNSNLAGTYRKAWSIYESTLVFEKNPYRGGTLTKKQALDMTGVLLVCDIALHIPVPMFDECLKKDYKVPEYYLPYIRFGRIMQTLYRNNGFPNAVEGENFYITLFDFIANNNGWPTFYETYEGWCKFFAGRMHRMFMVSDGYRMICAEYKKYYASELVVSLPRNFFIRTGVPALVRYYKGNDSFFEYIRLCGSMQMTVMDNHFYSPLKDPYVIMTNPVYRNSWTANTFFEEMSKKEGAFWPFQAGETFLREIFCRILAKEFYRAVQERSYLECPLAKLRCLAKTDACYCLKNLTKLPDHCCLAVWLRESHIQPAFLYWR